jgi:hypothetical protein
MGRGAWLSFAYGFCRFSLRLLPLFLMGFAAFPYGFCRVSLLVLPFFLMGFAIFPYGFCRISLWVLPYFLMGSQGIAVQWCSKPSQKAGFLKKPAFSILFFSQKNSTA